MPTLFQDGTAAVATVIDLLLGLSQIVGVWLVVGLVVAALCVAWMQGRQRA